MMRAASRSAARLRRGFSVNAGPSKPTSGPSTSTTSSSSFGAPALVVGLAVSAAVAKYQYDTSPTFKASVDSALTRAGLMPASPPIPKTLTPPIAVTPPAVPVLEAKKALEEKDEPALAVDESPEAEPVLTPVPLPVVAEPTPTPAPIPEPLPAAPAEPYPITARPPLVIDTKATLPVVTAEELARSSKQHESITRSVDAAIEDAALTRREIELSIIKDLNTLDEQSLRLRLMQLSSELIERAKWEGLRLHQALRQVESEVTTQYRALMAQQRAELEVEAQRASMRLMSALQAEASAKHEDEVVRFEVQLSEALRSQAKQLEREAEEALAAHGLKVQAELQDQLNHEVARLREAHVKVLVALQEKVEGTAGGLRALMAVSEHREERGLFSAASHLESSATLALERSLEGAEPLRPAVEALRSACAGDPLVTGLLNSLPEVALETGVASQHDLRARFEGVRTEVRKAALAPSNAPSLVGQAVGSVLASVSWAPSGFVPGTGVEEVLARAHFLLDHGDLRGCLKELHPVKGYSSTLMRDWVAQAEARLTLEMVTGALRANSALRHLTYSEAYAAET